MVSKNSSHNHLTRKCLLEFLWFLAVNSASIALIIVLFWVCIQDPSPHIQWKNSWGIYFLWHNWCINSPSSSIFWMLWVSVSFLWHNHIQINGNKAVLWPFHDNYYLTHLVICLFLMKKSVWKIFWIVFINF